MSNQYVDDARRDVWFFRREGRVYGPFPAKQLMALLEAGHLRPNQAVWKATGNATIYVRVAQALGESSEAT